MKQTVFIKKKRNPLIKQNPKIYQEKQKEKWAKQAREKETLTLTISSARALSRLFSFWPCDEDSCFSTSCEICLRTKARRNISTLQETFPIMTPFVLRFKNISAISRVLFNILQFFCSQLNLTAFFN